MEQTDEDVAETIARFRTPPGFGWEDLRNDILTLLRSRKAQWEARESACLMAMTKPLH